MLKMSNKVSVTSLFKLRFSYDVNEDLLFPLMLQFLLYLIIKVLNRRVLALLFFLYKADVMPPSVDCSGRDEVVMVLPPARGATVMLPSCEVSDNSGSSSLVRQSPTSGSFFPLGTTPVTNEYADISGNRGSDVFTVTVVGRFIEKIFKY